MSIDFNDFHNFLKEQHDNKTFNFESQVKGKWENAIQKTNTINKRYHVLCPIDSNSFTTLKGVQDYFNSYVFTESGVNDLVIYDLQDRKEIPFKKVKEGNDYKIIVLD